MNSEQPDPRAPSPYVNLADPRQDVHRVREHDPNQARYTAAEMLLPEHGDGAVLELGGGMPEFAQRLRSRGFVVTFADLSEANVSRAAAAGFETHQLDLNFPLPFPDASFEGATMLEVIEHVVAAEQLLSEISRVLKPGGFLLLSTPNFSYFRNRLRVLRGQLSEDEGYHYRFFNPATLNARLAHAGLALEATAHTTPAIGLNRINRALGRSRRHVFVPSQLASVVAQTLLVRARKTSKASSDESED
jgi:2-polyprenyl-3-methyl-5-hydroxy-6-metoxy-1,4-benzoquinol methylase